MYRVSEVHRAGRPTLLTLPLLTKVTRPWKPLQVSPGPDRATQIAFNAWQYRMTLGTKPLVLVDRSTPWVLQTVAPARRRPTQQTTNWSFYVKQKHPSLPPSWSTPPMWLITIRTSLGPPRQQQQLSPRVMVTIRTCPLPPLRVTCARALPARRKLGLPTRVPYSTKHRRRASLAPVNRLLVRVLNCE